MEDITYSLKDYYYEIPDDRIAYYPSLTREASKLLILDRQSGKIVAGKFYQITEYLYPGDLLVLNNTKVFPARLRGVKSTGGKVEIFLLQQMSDTEWTALVRPGRRIKPGTTVNFNNSCLRAQVLDYLEASTRRIRFDYEGDFWKILDEVGMIPLPPYIKRIPDQQDKERYQTVYAKERGAVAAPTAGFHFSKELLKELKQKGIQITMVTLHVGWGTFQKIGTQDIREHQIEKEYYRLSAKAARMIAETKNSGNRVIAVGTTSVRVLESAALKVKGNPLKADCDWTNLYIYPPFNFKVVDALITNFHLPGSSLILLVSAFAGRNKILESYRLALEKDFRFYSYGDSMFII
ncbi:tRNA preQ1(34) S-adenosylmethionine ribosyltransferase-isomerase QueA [bacterium]|nr:tRNA preQ1(34) S-adenosylmethionine ribosyltransferase-isomerase QueA [bacterium]